MFKIISGVIALTAAVVGDRILTKWLSAFKFWMERMADKRIKEAIQVEYLALDLEWQKIREKEREVNPPRV